MIPTHVVAVYNRLDLMQTFFLKKKEMAKVKMKFYQIPKEIRLRLTRYMDKSMGYPEPMAPSTKLVKSK